MNNLGKKTFCIDLIYLIFNLLGMGFILGLIPTLTLLLVLKLIPSKTVVFPTSNWVFILIIIFFIFFTPIISLADYLRRTKNRKADLQIFKKEQLRIFKLNHNFSINQLSDKLRNLGYHIIQHQNTFSSFQILATRKKDQMFSRLPNDQIRPDQKLTILGNLNDNHWNIEIKCSAIKWYIIGDLTQTSYLSIEELMKNLFESKS